jgi:hypothetical protein
MARYKADFATLFIAVVIMVLNATFNNSSVLS